MNWAEMGRDVYLAGDLNQNNGVNRQSWMARTGRASGASGPRRNATSSWERAMKSGGIVVDVVDVVDSAFSVATAAFVPSNAAGVNKHRLTQQIQPIMMIRYSHFKVHSDSAQILMDSSLSDYWLRRLRLGSSASYRAFHIFSDEVLSRSCSPYN